MLHLRDIEARFRLICLTLAFALTLVGFPSSARAGEPPLIERARALGIARSLGWLRLLHYRPTQAARPESDVDGAEFFLAPHGKDDPEAELLATLRAFLAPVVPGHEDAHALCRFPARRALLERVLRFEGPPPNCPALARYRAELDLEAVSVVYSANYLDNPASSFGHTFLRLKKRGGSGDDAKADHRDAAVDFTANTDTANPFLYAFKGLTGLFAGIFRFHPYESELRTYANFEARDMWEYDLALGPAEIRLLELHLWELSTTHIDYFYLTGNCSYQVLAVLEAAAPRIDLLSGAKTVVLPKDTVRSLFTIPGLVREIRYRPSLRSQFRAQIARLPPGERDLVEQLTEHPDAALPADLGAAERARVLDAAIAVLDARFARQMAARPDSAVLAARSSLVRRRALLIGIPPPPPVSAPLDKAPERGHDSMRIAFGTGITSQYRNSFGAIGYRLALHDLADPSDGQPELLQLEFLDAQVRYDLGRRELTVERLTFAEVLALNPITQFEKRLSWRARAFGVRLHDRGCSDCFAHGLEGGLGATFASEDKRAALFVMADAYLAFSGALDGIGGSFVRAGAGPYAGLRLRLPGRTIALFTGSVSYLPFQNLHGTYDFRATLRTALAKDVALGIEAGTQPRSSEVTLQSYVYF